MLGGRAISPPAQYARPLAYAPSAHTASKRDLNRHTFSQENDFADKKDLTLSLNLP